LRARVLAAMSDVRSPVPPASRWRRAWQAAAAIILILNLGMSIANGFRFERMAEVMASARPSPARPVEPREYDSEDRISVLASSAVSNWTPAPDVGPVGRTIFSREEDRRWALP
jgi:hypothetical protein